MKTISIIASIIIGLGTIIGTFACLIEREHEVREGTWHEKQPKYVGIIQIGFVFISVFALTFVGYGLGILIVRACGLDIMYALAFAFFVFACVALDFVEKTGRSHRAKEQKLEEEIKQFKDKLERSEDEIGWLRERISEYESQNQKD